MTIRSGHQLVEIDLLKDSVCMIWLHCVVVSEVEGSFMRVNQRFEPQQYHIALGTRFKIRISEWQDWITLSGRAHIHASMSEEVTKGPFMEKAWKHVQICSPADCFDLSLKWKFFTNGFGGPRGSKGKSKPDSLKLPPYVNEYVDFIAACFAIIAFSFKSAWC